MRRADPRFGDLEGDDVGNRQLLLCILSIRGAGHDDDTVCHHAAAVCLQAGPLERGPVHLCRLLQDEGPPECTRLRIPKANIVATAPVLALLVVLESYEVVTQGRKIERPDWALSH